MKPPTRVVSIRLTDEERKELRARGVRRGPHPLCQWLAEKHPDQPGESAIVMAQEESPDANTRAASEQG